MFRHKFLWILIVGLIALFAVNTTAQACTCPKGQHAEHGKCVPDNPTPTPPPVQTPPFLPPSAPQQQSAKPGWAACDWNIKDVPTEQMDDWQYRCQPAATSVAKVAPKISDCSVQDMILAQVRDGKQIDIWIYRPGAENGKGAFKVTWRSELKGQNVNASFSPNGCKIVLSNAGRLFVVSIDGSNVEQITSTGEDIQPNWSANWSIYFVRNSVLTVTDQWGHGLKGSKPESLNIKGFLPHASPDGLNLVFVDQNGQVNLFDKNTGQKLVTSIEAFNAIWDPKGRGLVYTNREKNSEFWFYNFATGGVTKFGRNPIGSRQTVLDPSGQNRMAMAFQQDFNQSPKLWMESFDDSIFVINMPGQQDLAFPDWWVPSSRRARFDQSFVTSFLATTVSDLSF